MVSYMNMEVTEIDINYSANKFLELFCQFHFLSLLSAYLKSKAMCKNN